jgi:hypothetical protein
VGLAVIKVQFGVQMEGVSVTTAVHEVGDGYDVVFGRLKGDERASVLVEDLHLQDAVR